jgi:hypothetical protein
MREEPESPAQEWSIRVPEGPPFVYDPRVHSRDYVRAQADRYPPEVADSIMRQAADLERRAVALGYQLASAEHGMEEVRDTHYPRYETPHERHPQND